MREDLAEIVLSAARLNSVSNVYVPTNGQHTQQTLSVLERTLPNAPQMRFHLNLSLDSTEESQYDLIRGKKKAYRRMMETWKAVQPLRRRFPNLVVHTLTTVMREKPRPNPGHLPRAKKSLSARRNQLQLYPPQGTRGRTIGGQRGNATEH